MKKTFETLIDGMEQLHAWIQKGASWAMLWPSLGGERLSRKWYGERVVSSRATFEQRQQHRERLLATRKYRDALETVCGIIQITWWVLIAALVIITIAVSIRAGLIRYIKGRG